MNTLHQNTDVKNIGLTPEVIADFFLAFANSAGDKISNLKLQKLVYYAEAWHLANFKKALFAENFQAWIHGPVLPSIYKKYKKYGCNPITNFKKTLDDIRKEGVISKQLFEFLEEVARVYMSYEAFQLETATHNEKPWQEARGVLALDARCSQSISKTTMTHFYKNLLHESRKDSAS